MPTLVTDLNLPFIKSVINKKEEINNILEIAKDNWLAKNPIGYVVITQEHCSAILKDQRWHSAVGLLSEINPNLSDKFKKRRQRGLLALDGEAHARIKRLVIPAFTNSVSDHLRPFMHELMESLLQPYLDKGKMDIQKDVFHYYPIPILCKLFGIPDSDWELFSNWSTLMFEVFNTSGEFDKEKIEKAQLEFDNYAEKLIEDKRRNKTNDLLSTLIQAEESGDKLSSEDLIMLIEIIIVTGIDTTRSQLGLIMGLLIKNPELLDLVRADNSKSKSIVDELIRLDSGLRGTIRIASDEIVYNEVIFPKGTLVFINISAANLDQNTFEDPNAIDIDKRNVNKVLSFGAGIHYCLGHSLAKAELQEAVAVMSNYLFDIKLDGEMIPLPETSIINAYESIPITFNSKINAENLKV